MGTTDNKSAETSESVMDLNGGVFSAKIYFQRRIYGILTFYLVLIIFLRRRASKKY